MQREAPKETLFDVNMTMPSDSGLVESQNEEDQTSNSILAQSCKFAEKEFTFTPNM